MAAADTLKRTPLHDIHVALGGKIVPFAGYEMPVQYAGGITAEHRAVREGCGIFDVSHMGEFWITTSRPTTSPPSASARSTTPRSSTTAAPSRTTASSIASPTAS